MSPDPCQGTGSASESSYLPERIAGRNLVNPVLTRISDFRRACKNVSGRGDNPASASRIGLANNSNVTMVEIGLAGRPKKYLSDRLLEGRAEVSRAGAPAPGARPNTT